MTGEGGGGSNEKRMAQKIEWRAVRGRAPRARMERSFIGNRGQVREKMGAGCRGLRSVRSPCLFGDDESGVFFVREARARSTIGKK
jgi:hypothetical protein